jgi:dTDP-4-dehydrorhamnose 3,5-epimerase
MKFFEIPLKEAYVIEPEPFKDSRGIFLRAFCKRELAAIGQCEDVVQVNHSVSEKPGTLRGMHFQKPPKAEAKYVKCIKGSVYDVIVDIRKDSSTFLKWHGETLTSDNMRMIYVPKGFAHGYQILEPNSEVLYFTTEFYSLEYEDGFRYDDPLVQIKWPPAVTELSIRDKTPSFLPNDFQGVELCTEDSSPTD